MKKKKLFMFFTTNIITCINFLIFVIIFEKRESLPKILIRMLHTFLGLMKAWIETIATIWYTSSSTWLVFVSLLTSRIIIFIITNTRWIYSYLVISNSKTVKNEILWIMSAIKIKDEVNWYIKLQNIQKESSETKINFFTGKTKTLVLKFSFCRQKNRSSITKFNLNAKSRKYFKCFLHIWPTFRFYAIIFCWKISLI